MCPGEERFEPTGVARYLPVNLHFPFHRWSQDLGSDRKRKKVQVQMPEKGFLCMVSQHIWEREEQCGFRLAVEQWTDTRSRVLALCPASLLVLCVLVEGFTHVL